MVLVKMTVCCGVTLVADAVRVLVVGNPITVRKATPAELA